MLFTEDAICSLIIQLGITEYVRLLKFIFKAISHCMMEAFVGGPAPLAEVKLNPPFILHLIKVKLNGPEVPLPKPAANSIPSKYKLLALAPRFIFEVFKI